MNKAPPITTELTAIIVLDLSGLVGSGDGAMDGICVGSNDGFDDGATDGDPEGRLDGVCDGPGDGKIEGAEVG